MNMNIFNHFQNIIIEIIKETFPDVDLDKSLLERITAESPRDPAHGDMATNASMILTKPLKTKPRDIAEKLVKKLNEVDDIQSAEIAGPGFINLRLSLSFWHRTLDIILDSGLKWGASDLGKGEKVNVEYVSANPTGPLHVAHGRGAVIGDVLANILTKVGYDVTKEYYVNDAGGQIDVLAKTLFLRYKEVATGEKVEIPEGLYPGEYMIDVAKKLHEQQGDSLLNKSEEEYMPILREFGIDSMLDLIKSDLALAGIKHDVFTSERSIVGRNLVEKALLDLENQGLIYEGVLEPPKGKKLDDWEARPQTLFKSTEYGDDVDRAVKKSDGTWTYFAPDIAYHYDKYNRGFKHIIDILGADHGGYVKRIKAVVTALSKDQAHCDVRLCQMVKLLKGGEIYKMSKRSGNFITLEHVINQVGTGAFRFMMLSRKSDAMLDFDIDKVIEQSKDNPVFYVQYSHARCHSVLSLASEQGIASESLLSGSDLSLLTAESELALIKKLSELPRILEQAGISRETQRIHYYVVELASVFHSLWNTGSSDSKLRFIIDGEPELTKARLSLVLATKNVLKSSLDVMGVKAINELKSNTILE